MPEDRISDTDQHSWHLIQDLFRCSATDIIGRQKLS